jgi:hypothetical protein
MSEDTTEKKEVAPAATPETIEALKEALAAKEKENAAIKANRDELLEEKKRQKKLADEAEENRKRTKEESLQEKGQFEQLFKSANQERETLKEQLKRIHEEKNQAAVRVEASKIANRLAEGHNAEILTDYIERRIKCTEEGFKVTDASGALTVSALSDLENEFATSEKYKSLRRGTKASGGSATGSGAGGSSNSKVIDRVAFNAMKSFEQSDFISKGGKVTD